MTRLPAILGAGLVLVVAIALAVDLFLAWSEGRRTSGRQTLVAISLVALVTFRIIERVTTGTL